MRNRLFVALAAVALAIACAPPQKAPGTPEEIKSSDEIREAYLGI